MRIIIISKCVATPICCTLVLSICTQYLPTHLWTFRKKSVWLHQARRGILVCLCFVQRSRSRSRTRAYTRRERQTTVHRTVCPYLLFRIYLFICVLWFAWVVCYQLLLFCLLVDYRVIDRAKNSICTNTRSRSQCVSHTDTHTLLTTNFGFPARLSCDMKSK